MVRGVGERGRGRGCVGGNYQNYRASVSTPTPPIRPKWFGCRLGWLIGSAGLVDDWSGWYCLSSPFMSHHTHRVGL